MPQTRGEDTMPSYRKEWEPLTGFEWIDFHRNWWGARDFFKDVLNKPLQGRWLDGGVGAVRNGLDMRPDTGISTLFVREDYVLFSERLRNGREKPFPHFGVLLLGQREIGKSLFLLFLLVECLSREELVLFTSTSEVTFLFDKHGVARMNTSDLPMYGNLPPASYTGPGIWSLVDCPENEKLVSPPAMHPDLFFVAALTPDDKRYHYLTKGVRVRSWHMSPWNNDELLPLLRALPSNQFAPALRERFRVMDAAAVASLVSQAGPCPADILQFLHDPSAHAASVRSAVDSYRGQPIALIDLLNGLDRALAQPQSRSAPAHAVALLSRLDPLSPTTFEHDDGPWRVGFKTRAIYERMLDGLLVPPSCSGVWALIATRQLQALVGRTRGFADAVPFIFDHFAAVYTQGSFPLDEDAEKHYFVPMAMVMAPAPLGSTTSCIRFVYRRQADEPGAAAHHPPARTLVVDASDGQTVSCSWQASPGPSPPASQAIASISTQEAEAAAAPWHTRRRVLYETIDDLALDAVSYYTPSADIRARDPPFTAFFFQAVPPARRSASDSDGNRDRKEVIVLWVLCIAARRGPASGSQSLWSGAGPDADVDAKTILNFDTVRELLTRARKAWTSLFASSARRVPVEVEVEVKYVLVVPHEDARGPAFDVEWRFPTSASAAEVVQGETLVQFLDVSGVCGVDPCLPPNRDTWGVCDWGRCAVEDVVGMPARVPADDSAGGLSLREGQPACASSPDVEPEHTDGRIWTGSDAASDVGVAVVCGAKRRRDEEPGALDEFGEAETEGAVSKKTKATDES